MVRAILCDSNGKVMLGKRAGGLAEGQWAIIGGKLDEGENLEEAVIREVKEEVGVDFEPLFWKESLSPDGEWKTTYYVGRYVGEVVVDSTEVKGVIYASREDLQALDIAFDHRTVLEDFFANNLE